MLGIGSFKWNLRMKLISLRPLCGKQLKNGFHQINIHFLISIAFFNHRTNRFKSFNSNYHNPSIPVEAVCVQDLFYCKWNRLQIQLRVYQTYHVQKVCLYPCIQQPNARILLH